MDEKLLPLSTDQFNVAVIDNSSGKLAAKLMTDLNFRKLLERTSDTLIGYLPIFQMLPKTSLYIRYHWYPFELDA